MNTFTDKDDKRIEELYTGVFDEIRASDELKRKVTNMDTSAKKKGLRTAVKVLCTAAALMALLVVSNVIAYATTGETLIHMVVNGIDYTFVASEYEASNGDIYFYTCTDTDGFNTMTFYYVDESGEEADTDIYIDTFTADIVEESGRTYLEIAESERIDITDDLADDGYAEGTFTYSGTVYSYETDGSDLSWTDGEFEEDIEDEITVDDENGETAIFSSTVEAEE